MRPPSYHCYRTPLVDCSLLCCCICLRPPHITPLLDAAHLLFCARFARCRTCLHLVAPAAAVMWGMSLASEMLAPRIRDPARWRFHICRCRPRLTLVSLWKDQPRLHQKRACAIRFLQKGGLLLQLIVANKAHYFINQSGRNFGPNFWQQ